MHYIDSFRLHLVQSAIKLAGVTNITCLMKRQGLLPLLLETVAH
jgi:hypothetical protein